MDNNSFPNALSQASSLAPPPQIPSSDDVRKPPVKCDASSIEKLMHEGELALLHGEPHGLDFFEKALALSPSDFNLYIRQALAIYEFAVEEKKEKYLLLACKKFKKASELNPSHPDIWQGWASCLLTLGNTYEEFHYFQKAHDVYLKALELSQSESPDVVSELYWEFALVLMQFAYRSEEAVDYQKAIAAFEKASEASKELPSGFWSQFAEACIALSHKVHDADLIIRASNYYKRAIALSDNCFDEWLDLANALSLLYEKTQEEDHFNQANDCFASAAKLTTQDADLWLSWAKLLWYSGYRTQNSKRLRSCIEKCHRAFAIDSSSTEALAIWAQSLAMIGLNQERLHLIQEAENKALEALEIDQSPELQMAHGLVLKAMGAYYSDPDYLYQAIEKLQEGISLDRSQEAHWFEMARCYTQAGILLNDVEHFQTACRFYTKALHISPFNSLYYYECAWNIFKLGETLSNKDILEQSLEYFEKALQLQKNAFYLQPAWLFHYGIALDAVGEYHDEEHYYTKALGFFTQVLMLNPSYPQLHHQIGLTLSHLAELIGESDHYFKAIHHLRIAYAQDEENELALMDWGLALINLSLLASNKDEMDRLQQEAEVKLMASAKLGLAQAYYHLACLFSLKGDYERSIFYMEKAYSYEVLPSIEDLQEDEWLERLRMTSYFKDLIYRLEKDSNVSGDF